MEICKTTVAPRPEASSLGGNAAATKVTSLGGTIARAGGGDEDVSVSGPGCAIALGPIASAESSKTVRLKVKGLEAARLGG